MSKSGSLAFFYISRDTSIAYQYPKIIFIACALLILYVLGVIDDIWGVRYRMKFIFQILAAIFVIISGIWIKSLHGFCGIEGLSDWAGILLTIFLLVFIVNSFNFIDGIDGLATCLAIVALLIYGIISVKESKLLYSLATSATLGALIPFCYFNLFRIRRKYTSKIFMGDGGTLVIGFVLGILALSLWNTEGADKQSPDSQIVAYSMLIVPCFDTIRVCIYRIRRGKSLFSPDRNHIHHQLMKIGFSQHQVVLILTLVQILFFILNICLTNVLNITCIVAIDILCATMLFILIKKKLKTKQ